MRAFLDRKVYVAIRDLVLDFVIEDGLEGAYDLLITRHVSKRGPVAHSDRWLGCVKKARTTTPPMSNRMAFGGFEEVMIGGC